MIRSVIAVVVASGALAACQPTAPAGGVSLAEKRLAEKIIDAGVLIPLDKDGLQQVAFQQVQGMMYQDGLSPQEARQVMLSITKNLEVSTPEFRQQMVETLAQEFSVKEMELLLKFVTSKEGKAIQEKMPAVGEKSSEQFRAHAQLAGAKALEDVRKAWPTPPAKTPPAAATAPADAPGPIPN
jgi:hypothetical protein